VKIHFKEKSGKIISTYSNHPDKESKEEKLTLEPGGNQLIWNMRYPDAESFDGMILWWSSLSGPTALPGKYDVALSVNGKSQTQEFEIIKDPRSSASQEDLQAQFDFQNNVISKLSETNLAIKDIRRARVQIEDVIKKADADTIKNMGNSILKEMKEIEEALYQTKNRSGQDPLNYPIRLNNKLGHLNSLVGMGDFKPTESAIEFSKEVTARIDKHLGALNEILETKIRDFNDLVQANNVKAVKLE
jgi:hypothetical protein